MSKKITSNDIKKSLWHHYSNYDYRLFNSYIFDWESDFFFVSKDKGYAYEIEIKISKGDFKADFKKGDKHHLLTLHKSSIITQKTSLKAFGLINGKQTQLYSGVSFLRPQLKIPNKFYYACPEGLLKAEDVPEYAGLLFISKRGVVTKIKEAPFLHKNNLLLRKKAILLEKFYLLSLNKNRSLKLLEHDHKVLIQKFSKVLELLEKNKIEFKDVLPLY
jgi:hypothetical protein